MKPLFHPSLVNGVFGDPLLFVDFQFEKRALLFDLGDVHELAARKLLRLSHVFVTHAHMDHFMGFDMLLRVCLGREKKLHLFGPPNIIQQVQSKLGGYTWNLVKNYEADFTIEVNEIYQEKKLLSAQFCCQKEFLREDLPSKEIRDGEIVNEAKFNVRTVQLDHKIPSFAFAIEEKQHINIWKTRLEALDLPTGPWLQELKEAIINGNAEESQFRVWWRENGVVHEKYFPLKELVQEIVQIVPGQKLVYVTDAIYNENNKCKIIQLAQNADMLFIESPFKHQDAEQARRTYHLTTYQAGSIARAARVKNLQTFHYSARYGEEAEVIQQEVLDAFSGNISSVDNKC